MIVARLWRAAFRRGVIGGERRWLYIAAVTGTIQAIRWISGRGSPVVFSETLEPGEQLVITHEPPR